MATEENGRIVESAPKARQAEPGPSVFVLMAVSTVAAIVILGGMWMFLFK
jgi:hypothetical protein